MTDDSTYISKKAGSQPASQPARLSPIDPISLLKEEVRSSVYLVSILLLRPLVDAGGTELSYVTLSFIPSFSRVP